MRDTSPLTAETIALTALAFLAAVPDDLSRFLAVSGADVPSLRQRVEEPAFLAAILEFILANENLLTEFCESESLPAEDVHLAAAWLGGSPCA